MKTLANTQTAEKDRAFHLVEGAELGAIEGGMMAYDDGDRRNFFNQSVGGLPPYPIYQPPEYETRPSPGLRPY